MRAWAQAAGVVKRWEIVILILVRIQCGYFIFFRYKYSKDDEEIYKEFMEINNELIPHMFKTKGMFYTKH